MRSPQRKRRVKRLLLIGGGLVVLGLGLLMLLANVWVEPALRKKLHTLIIDGSDSLYRYRLGSLRTNLFGGSIEVNDLEIKVDSNRYRQLQEQSALPALVVQLQVQKASIKGVGIFSLLFSKKVKVAEIISRQANIRVLRNLKVKDTTVPHQNKPPLWKALRPAINDVVVNKIQLDGIRLNYRNSEDIDAAKLQFDNCDAVFENIRIDSTAALDTTRFGYVERFSFRLHDLKFRTPDSAYKLKAEWITYNSATRLLQVDSFKLQPTLAKEERTDSLRRSWYTVIFNQVRFNGLRLDRYLRLNRAEADSVVFEKPLLQVYLDKKGEKSYVSKIGRYPHQQLLSANAVIDIQKLVAHGMEVVVTEKHAETREEGTISLKALEIQAENIVNDPVLVRRNPVVTASASGTIIGSPISARFRFYLDSAEGRFDATGQLQQVTAQQINPLSLTLANIEVPSALIQSLDFRVRGEDYGAEADVRMRYSNLSIVFLKRDEETGDRSTRTFLTKLLNKYAIYTSNPAGGTERQATGVKTARLTTQSFFGVIWQAVFSGMQNIILKTG